MAAGHLLGKARRFSDAWADHCSLKRIPSVGQQVGEYSVQFIERGVANGYPACTLGVVGDGDRCAKSLRDPPFQGQRV